MKLIHYGSIIMSEMTHYDEKAKDLKVLFVRGKISEEVFVDEMNKVQFEQLEGVEVNSFVIDSAKFYGQC